MQLAPHDALRAATYTSNYYAGRSWFFGHTWSLSVEEQFYLLWPAVLLLAGARRAFLIAAGVVLICPFIRLAEWELFRSFGDGIGARFETVADSIAIGCLLAGARPDLHRSARYLSFLKSPLFAVVPLLALAGNLTHDHPIVHFAVGMTVVNVAVVLCLDWCVTFHDGRIGRLLNAAPLVFVGWLSYSLYLWQQPFLDRASTAAVAAFPLNIILTIALALASYYLVERPSLQLRRRLERLYSDRSAVKGSMPAARRAGIHAATVATDASTTTAAAKASGSQGVFEQDRREQTCNRQRRRYAARDASERVAQAGQDYHPRHLSRLRADRPIRIPILARPLTDRMSHHAVDPGGRQQDRYQGECAHEPHPTWRATSIAR